MKIHTLHKVQVVSRPLGEVFSFFEKPENLAMITPPWLGFRILTPLPVVMKKDAVFDYSIRVMGLRMRWKSLVSEYRPPHMFVDEQIEGPYRYWRHTHAFAEVEEGTRITDEIRYAMPFGILGEIVQRLAMRRQLEAIFAHRARVISEIFEEEEVVR